jgi:D-alanyl-D-alanine carboxypeptidase/D-alanyl-D-alanine-endopeptidase (penicillin-binding protein 4)
MKTFTTEQNIQIDKFTTARADLPGDIRSVLGDKYLQKVQTGIYIVRLDGGGKSNVLYERSASNLFIPASNLKIITASAALDTLGPDFKFRTLLVQRGNDLALVGDGDPTLGDAEMLRKVGWDVDTVFRNWAEQLKKRNITSVGRVLVDDSVFDEQFLHPSWPTDQEHKRYVAQVGGLNLNANCIDFYVRPGAFGAVVDYAMNPATRYVSVRNTCATGNENAIWLARQPGTNEIILKGETRANVEAPVSVTIHDPSMFAGTVLAETLAANGVNVAEGVVRDRTVRQSLAKGSVIAVHETPLVTVLARSNKDSMNLYAESLCKRIGYETTKSSGSWQNGTAAMAAFLKKAGVEEGQWELDDGCGLSKKDQISPTAIVRVLAYNFRGKSREIFLGSLAVAGIDGTLDDRFKGTDLRGRVFGKSGFVSGVSSLSGYLHGKDDQWYAFAIMMNGIATGTNSTAKQLQERIVRAIDSNATSMAAGSD